MRGFIVLRCGDPVICKSSHQPCTSRIYCDTELRSTNECTKLIQYLRHVLSYLSHIDLSLSNQCYNENHAYVVWSNIFTKKGTKYISLHDNPIKEFVQLSTTKMFTKGLCNEAHFIALQNEFMHPIPQR